MSSALAVTPREIAAAAEAIRGAVVETPCLPSRTLSEITGVQVVLKFENLQYTASFKERGALSKLLSLGPEERTRGVVAMSAGNHAQAVAYHASRLGIAATIVMPRFTPSVKVEHTRAFGAEVLLDGESLEEAGAVADGLVRERGLHLVHPYDDPRIIAGQGTVALEMLQQVPDLDVLVIPVGGGGLIGGSAIAARSLAPAIEIIGVETERYPSMRQALDGVPIECGTGTIAEGIAVKEPGRLTLPIVRELVSDVLLVSEARLEQAVLLLLEVEKSTVEGAGAAGLAALLDQPERFAGRKVGVILSGGNIDPLILSSIIRRGLVRSGRLVRLLVELRDVPGSLAEIARVLADEDANVIEVHHQRAFSSLPLQSAEVEFVLQLRGLDHVERVFAALRSRGYAARRRNE